MKEFISIACIFLCGLLAFFFFSSRITPAYATTPSDSSSLSPNSGASVVPMTMECYGNVPATVNLGTQYVLAINCAQGAATNAQNCTGPTDVVIAFGYNTNKCSGCGSCNSWNDWEDCNGHNDTYSYSCTIACATVTVSATAPQHPNCSWTSSP
jgi:hypothetical protein